MLRPSMYQAPLAVTALTFSLLTAAPEAQAPREHKDLVYATVNGKSLALDLYLPANAQSPRLLVWLHGGVWRTGNKSQVPRQFVENGYATASVEFHLSTEARFPQQVHDIKAAIRFLRGNAKKYGYRTDKIAIAGASSGGHLAALVAVTNGHKELEGGLGDFTNESSRVDAVMSYFGASNLSTVVAQSTPYGLKSRVPGLDLFIGGQADKVPDVARLASPVTHVDRSDPPLLLFHGDQDVQMPINQAHELEGAYQKQGLDVRFHVLHGVGHGGPAFYEPVPLKIALEFLARTLGT